MMQFTTWDILRNLLLAARWTVLLSIVAFIGGGLLGMVILFLRTAKNKAAQRFAWGYIELFQGTPLLMQLFLVFFGLPKLGIGLDGNQAALLAMSLMMLGYALVPITPTWGVAAPELGLLFFFAIAGLAVYAVMLGGWSSNSKYSLLGGLRSTAQTISSVKGS